MKSSSFYYKNNPQHKFLAKNIQKINVQLYLGFSRLAESMHGYAVALQKVN